MVRPAGNCGVMTSSTNFWKSAALTSEPSGAERPK